MDGTFGVCSARVLLFILMVIDNCNRGIPVAFYLFSAKEDHTAVHASYNTAVLAEGVQRFKEALGKNAAGEEFDITVANIDNDSREQYAISAFWPNIQLLLCAFHTWQFWRGGLDKYLRIIPKGDARKDVCSDFGTLLRKLINNITNYRDAITAYNVTVINYCINADSPDAIAQKQAQGALAFLAYLSGYLKNKSYWRMWSAAGSVAASARLHTTPDQVARTTNHLEFFNGRIKCKFFGPYMLSSRLPRLNVYTLVLIKKVMPQFFDELRTNYSLFRFKISLMMPINGILRPVRLYDDPPSDAESDYSSDYTRSLSYNSQSCSDASESDCDNIPTSPLMPLPALGDNKNDTVDEDLQAIPGYGCTLELEAIDAGNQTVFAESASINFVPTLSSPSEVEPTDDFLLSANFNDAVYWDSDPEMSGLPTDFLDALSRPPSNSGSPALLLLLPALPSPSVDVIPLSASAANNYAAIAHRELLVAENHVADALCMLMLHGQSAEDLSDHMSPAIQECLRLKPPATLPVPSATLASQPSLLLAPDQSMQPSLTPALQPDQRRLESFGIQLKEKRKPARGCR